LHLIQLFLPLYDPEGRPFPPETRTRVREELAERFGGVTAYGRAPAQGLWKPEEDERPVKDDLVVVEVMAETLDRNWWSAYRAELERRFAQDAVLIRAHPVDLL